MFDEVNSGPRREIALKFKLMGLLIPGAALLAWFVAIFYFQHYRAELFEKKEYGSAYRAAGILLVLVPWDATPGIFQGRAMMKQGKYSEAIRKLTATIERSGCDVNCKTNGYTFRG